MFDQSTNVKGSIHNKDLDPQLSNDRLKKWGVGSMQSIDRLKNEKKAFVRHCQLNVSKCRSESDIVHWSISFSMIYAQLCAGACQGEPESWQVLPVLNLDKGREVHTEWQAFFPVVRIGSQVPSPSSQSCPSPLWLQGWGERATGGTNLGQRVKHSGTLNIV